jgi:hypothetical protein
MRNVTLLGEDILCIDVAADNEQWDTVSRLLNKYNANANPNHTGHMGQSVLMLAVTSGNLNVVNQLLACDDMD